MSERTERAARLRDLASRLRGQGKEVADLHGDSAPPEGELSPADRLWWTVQDAADELEHMADALTSIEARRGNQAS